LAISARPERVLTIGSRGSALALWQARWIAGRLEALGQASRIEIIHTTGDRARDVSFAKVGTKGMFTKEIEEALLTGAIDLAVHSLKDMPAELPEGLALAAIPAREDPRDALVGCKLSELRKGARVGSSSLRRAAQLRAARPDLLVEDIRGNVDTRLRKLDEGQFDAILLASAGLNRLGWSARIAETLPAELMCPAVGQGALAVEVREGGKVPAALLASLDDPDTRAAVTAERALLGALGGGCQVPMGAFAEMRGGELSMQAVVVSPDGLRVVRYGGGGRDPVELGNRAGDYLLAHGAREILNAVYSNS
jgi:hydroxymethylbilane synthase